MEDLSQKINAIAEAMSKLEPGSTRYEALEIKICRLLHKQKGFADVFESSSKSYVQKENNYYDPVVFSEVYLAAIRDFCNPEKGLDDQGNKKSFLHLFNTYYKVKEPEVKTAKYEENTYGGLKEKRKYIRNIVNMILKKHKAKTVYTDFNVFDDAKVMELLLKAGASQEEINSYNDALEINVGSLTVGDDEEEKPTEDPTASKVAYQSEEARKKAQEEAFEQVAKVASKAVEKYQGKKMERYIKMYLTMLISKELDELSPKFLQTMTYIMDEDFMRFIVLSRNKGEKSDIAIWAAYLDYKHDSARKQMKRIENLLKELA